MPKKVTTKKVTAKATTKAVKRPLVKNSAGPKTAKKTTTKKASASTKQKTKMLVCASDDKCFWTTDGQVLKNLEELQFAFGTMGEEVFLHHVNKEKNDFADWVEHVLEDAACAEALRKSRKPTVAKTVVVKHLRHYSL